MARRNANGEGSVFKRKDGRWESSIYLPTISGRTKRLRFYGKTRAEAYDKLIEAKTQVRRGIAMADKSWTVADYLDYWLEEVVRPTRRPKTYEVYEARVRLNLKPGLGHLALDRLSLTAVQTFMNQQLAAGHSVRKVHIMREVLSAALTRAQREELVSRNVARLVELEPYRRDEIRPWSADEAKKFLEAAQGDALCPAFTLLMLYGLRRGEVLGLRWQDIDFESAEIHVRQQLQRVGDTLYQGPLKTKAGRRDLPLLGFARDVLVAHQSRQETLRGAAGAEWAGAGNQQELVFTTKNGTPIEPRNFGRSFQRIYEQHNIRAIRVHDVRHTTATLLKNLGVPARDAQLILGHSQISTTQEIYQHDDMEGRRDSLGRIEALFMNVSEGGRSRQNSRKSETLPSTPTYTRLNTSVNHGWRGRIRTFDLLFQSSISYTSADRITSVLKVAKRRSRAWILGCVAVSAAVNNKPTDHGSWKTIHLCERPKGWSS